MAGTPSVIEGITRRWVTRHIILGFAVSLGIGEAYRRLFLEPSRQQRRDYYRENFNIDYDKLI